MTDCTAPRHADDPVDAEEAAYLCGPCKRRTSYHLRQLPALHARLEDILILTSATATGSIAGTAKTRTTSDDDNDLRHLLRQTVLPFNPAVSDCRSQIRHDLTWWCRHLTAERPDLPPPPAGDQWAANPVPAMAGWLHAQRTWYPFRAWAGDMAGAFAADTGWARSLLDPRPASKFPIPSAADALCIGCGEGRVEVTIYAEDDRRPSFIACPACGRRWTDSQFRRYGERVVARRQQAAS